MQECEEVTPSTSCRKRRKKRSFRFSTMKELKKAREYKSKKRLNTEEASSVQKIIKYPLRAQKHQDIGKVSNPEDGNQTPQLNTLVVGSDDDKEAGQEDEDDSPRVDRIVVRRPKPHNLFECSRP